MADQATTPSRVQKPTRPRRKWLWVAGAMVIVLALAGAVFMLLRPQTPVATTRTFTLPVTKTTEQVTVNLTGTLAPQNQANLSFASAGTVTSVSAVVGSTVSAGQVLATIDDTQLRNAVTLAQANVTAARTSYSTVASTSGVTRAQLSNAQAQIDSAVAKLSSAKTSLSQARLTTPIAGTVASVNLTVGSQVGSGSSGGASAAGVLGSSGSAAASAQIVVISPTSWLVNGTVGPADVASLKPGQPVAATVTGTTVTTTGKVNTVGIVATTSSGSTTFPVTILLDGNPAGLYDGVGVTAVVTTGTDPDVLSVPTAAISNTGGTPTVQKMVNGSPITTEVQLGKVYGDRTQVASGVAEGDLVQVTVRVAAGQRPSGGGSSGVNFPGMGGQGQGQRPNNGGAPPAGAPAGGGG
ncbi:efflux RND transporter periplasmic adaptor subunit [Propioniciclava tarda]|nr:HlyD family efflux transporter periplasmic adaptor subunit [Propioniciclava tarda]SMO73827.1 Multidrug efflux pump subunit AcrA (membrane-fusion protein) [Propioniciclava tarda]